MSRRIWNACAGFTTNAWYVPMTAIAGHRELPQPLPMVNREKVIRELIIRLLQALTEPGPDGSVMPLDLLINDAIYHERKRLERENGVVRKRELVFWREANHALLEAAPEQLPALLERIIRQHLEEILGNFDPRVYELSTHLVPALLTLLLNALSPARLVRSLPSLTTISHNLIIRGEVDQLRALSQRGTVLLVPTHVSNLDSVAMGYALYLMGLPPFLYGAGINLFTNSIMSFFMNNLGAYKVDRKKQDRLYKTTLKEFSAYMVENGYHSLFFPGGTRSRSGELEQSLKLGLLGTGLEAFINNLKSGKPDPRIFIVPCTLSYQLVLEAESLITNFLESAGGSKFVIPDDEFEKPSRWLSFFLRAMDMDSTLMINIAPALDPFGNRVTADGLSLDNRGRQVDITRYVLKDGTPNHDAQRDCEYTHQLGEAVVAAYHCWNSPRSTHIAALAMFELIRAAMPDADLFRLLRVAPESSEIGIAPLLQAISRTMTKLKELRDAGRIQLSPRISAMTEEEIVEEALDSFSHYHQRPAMIKREEWMVPRDMKLLYYYANRLRNYGLEPLIRGEA